jgi:AcrR family transcriptional regulator
MLAAMPPQLESPAPTDRRHALVQVAYGQLAQRGFEGLRTREVAAGAGVNIATLHYYFPSKETLIGAVLAHAMERFRSTMDVSAGSTGDQLRRHFDGLRRLHREEPELFAVMGELALRSARDPVIRDLYQQTLDTWRRVIRGLLVKAGKDGSLAVPHDPDAQASLVVAAVMGACMIPLGRPSRLTETLRELQRSLGLRTG